MAACAAEGFFLDLAAPIAALEEGAALAALHQLIARSLAEEIDRSARRYRLHALVREAVGGGPFRQAHAEAVRRRFKNWEADWRRCEQELPSFRLALEWALENAPDSRPQALAYNGWQLAYRIGGLAEALEVCERVRQAGEGRQDRRALGAWLGNQSRILWAWGRLEEALALHKKQEAICLELGSKVGLAYCYWQWGLLERARGNPQDEHAKLSAALALFGERGMPRERDAVQAEVAKAGAASSS